MEKETPHATLPESPLTPTPLPPGERGRGEGPETATAPIIGQGYTFDSITDKISSIVLTKPLPRSWYVGFGVAFLLVMLLF
jgi:hypothetical protein